MADEEGSTVSDAQLLSEIKVRNTDVTNLINRKDKINAMKASLKNPPVQTKTPEVKDENAKVVEKVVTSMTEAEIKAVVEALDQEECEILLRYIYRFMGKNVGLNVTLKFHAALSDKAGTAGILRVLTDRKTV